MNKKVLLLSLAVSAFIANLSAMDSDPNVVQLRTAVQIAGIPTQSFEGAIASIDGAWANGARGAQIEALAKELYKTGILSHNSAAKGQADMVDPSLPFVDYVKQLNSVVLPTGAPAAPEASVSDISVVSQNLEQSIAAENFDSDVVMGLRQSIRGAMASSKTAAELEDKAKQYFLDGYLSQVPSLCMDPKAKAKSMGDVAVRAALKAVNPAGKSLVEYTKALNLAAGYTEKGLY
jgi:hypothetical protein